MQVANQQFVGQDKASAESIRYQFPDQVIDEFVAPMIDQILSQVVDALPFRSAWKHCVRINRSATEILVSPLSDWPEPFERQPDRVKPFVAARTTCVFAVFRQSLTQGQFTELRLIIRQLRNVRRRWRNSLTE